MKGLHTLAEYNLHARSPGNVDDYRDLHAVVDDVTATAEMVLDAYDDASVRFERACDQQALIVLARLRQRVLTMMGAK